MPDLSYLLLTFSAFALFILVRIFLKIQLAKLWRGIFFGLAVMLFILIPWEVWFSYRQIWGWSESKLFGVFVATVPMEEVLWFVAMALLFVAIYEWLGKRPADVIKQGYPKRLTAVLSFGFFLCAIVFAGHIYTFAVASFAAVFLVWHLLIARADYIARFYLAFVIYLLPLLVLDIMRTGSFSDEPTIWYKSSDVMGLYLFKVPLENIAMYFFLMLVFITAYESLKVRSYDAELSTG